jgi:hypothetical protein
MRLPQKKKNRIMDMAICESSGEPFAPLKQLETVQAHLGKKLDFR